MEKLKFVKAIRWNANFNASHKFVTQQILRDFVIHWINLGKLHDMMLTEKNSWTALFAFTKNKAKALLFERCWEPKLFLQKKKKKKQKSHNRHPTQTIINYLTVYPIHNLCVPSRKSLITFVMFLLATSTPEKEAWKKRWKKKALKKISWKIQQRNDGKPQN